MRRTGGAERPRRTGTQEHYLRLTLPEKVGSRYERVADVTSETGWTRGLLHRPSRRLFKG
jgi:hypothetical protein